MSNARARLLAHIAAYQLGLMLFTNQFDNEMVRDVLRQGIKSLIEHAFNRGDIEVEMEIALLEIIRHESFYIEEVYTLSW